MEMDKELIDQLLAGYEKPEDLIGESGLLKQLTKALVERALQAELITHLGYEKHSPEGHLSGDTRNGVSTKQMKGDFGEVQIEVPRTGRRTSSRSWWPRARRALPDSTTRFFHCTLGA
jgi:putative transposase